MFRLHPEALLGAAMQYVRRRHYLGRRAFPGILVWLTCLHAGVMLGMRAFSVAQSCPLFATPWTVAHQAPLVGNLHGISQARILEWVAIFFSRGSSPPKDQTRDFCLAGRFFTTEPPGKPCCLAHSRNSIKSLLNEQTLSVHLQILLV